MKDVILFGRAREEQIDPAMARFAAALHRMLHTQ